MVYSVVPTAVTGDLWTAANHNTYIKDNFAAGVPDIFTAAGDMPYATATNAASPLAIGEARKHLMVNDAGDAPLWRSPLVGCGIKRVAAQAVLKDTVTKIEFDTEIYDTDSFFTTDDSDEILIPYDAVYQISGFVTHTAIAGSSTPTRVYIGSTIIKTAYPYSTEATINFCYTDRFTAATDVCLSVYHGSTSSEDFTAEYQVTYLGTST